MTQNKKTLRLAERLWNILGTLGLNYCWDSRFIFLAILRRESAFTCFFFIEQRLRAIADSPFEYPLSPCGDINNSSI